jgi:hypothetical protein
MSAIQKVSGTLTMGPTKQDNRVDTVYEYIRVGSAYLERVKIPGILNSLLRNGAPCTLWVATFKTPSPFFYSTEIRVVYAVEIGGVVHKAIKEVSRGWTSGKWITVAMLAMVGLFTILLYIGILFWINAIRLSFVELPIDEMRREPA